jgi:MFS family permease
MRQVIGTVPVRAYTAAMSEAPTGEVRYAWVVVWATFVALAVIFGVSYSFAAFFESFAAAFDAQRADVSLVFGLSGGVYFVFGAAGGMLADRFGPRAVTCSGMLLIAAGLLLCSFAESMAMVYAAYGVGVGLGIALVYTPSIGCVQPWFGRRRGLAAGIASAGIGAGTFVVPLLAAAAIVRWDWRGALWALSIGVLVVGVGSTLSLRTAPVATRRAGSTVPGQTLAEALRSSSFRWLYAMCVLGAPAMFIPFAHLSASARDLGIGDAQAVGLVGLIGIGSLTGRFAVGWVADRFGRPRALVGVQASLGLSMLLWWAAGDYSALALFALWMGLSYGGAVSLMPALCMDLYGARAVASIIGTLYTGAALGNVAGPWLAGRVFDATGGYAPVILGCALLAALATLAARQAVRR